MLTKKTKYALLALTALAKTYGQGLTQISEISTQQRIPHKFLELILLDLKNLGFLVSKKGRGGGYALARPPAGITMGEIVRSLEGPVAALPCAGPAPKACNECDDVESCGLRMVMTKVSASMDSVLDRTSLAAVLEWEEQALNRRAHDSSYQI
ncbi:MAG: Rrf2 family transcriptional regulator [Planctomycetes bacterium]|nr:Rrf2 family transcriptional regulator [Planctomycetota bacterium]